jgi:hypothetical protein
VADQRDAGEKGEGVTEQPDWVPGGIEVTVPNAARVYDYMLGGYHNFAADRDFVEQALLLWPEAVAVGHANRAFMRRSIRWLVDAGVRQFLDLGSGIPTLGNVHEIAQAVAPESRVMYVDIDPVAVAHSKAMLAGNPLVDALEADLVHPEDILFHDDVVGLLDFARPTAVVLNSVLHFLPDLAEITAMMATIRAALTPGSYVVLSHSTLVPELSQKQQQIGELYQKATPTRSYLRSRAEVLAMVSGMELVEPGIVPVTDWHPDPEENGDVPQPSMLAVVARQP